MAETGAEPGGWILFGLPELGVVGPAYVVMVEPCPPVEAGPGRVVLATVTHYNSFVLRLWVAGLDEPLEPTAEHPLYSEDRQAWVPAGELCVGERLRTAAGPAAHAGTVRRGTKGRPQGDSNPCRVGDVGSAQVAQAASDTEQLGAAPAGVWRAGWRETWPELGAVVDGWATLPDPIRQAIVTLARAGRR
ncbi:MAG: hypothetical protein KA383_09910 [Phycisphaerae bacterium]|nr:hypothetical protein [Phycisphaerae bacterium]